MAEINMKAYAQQKRSENGKTKSRALKAWSPLIYDVSLDKLVKSPSFPKIKADLVQTGTITVENHVKHLWITSAFSDAKIRLRDGNEIRVHKSVLARCSFFKAAFESLFKEAIENCIEFPEDDECAVVGLLMHLYGFNEAGWAITMFGRERMRPNHSIDLHKVAVKYHLPILAACAMGLFTVILEGCIAWSVSNPEGDGSIAVIKYAALRLYRDEDDNDDDYSPLLVEFLTQIRAHWPALVKCRKESFQEIFNLCPQFAVDLLLGDS